MEVSDNTTYSEIITNYAEFKKSVRYNRFMYNHYRMRFHQARYSGNFIRLFFIYRKMIAFKKALAEAGINDLLTHVNKKSYVHIQRA